MRAIYARLFDLLEPRDRRRLLMLMGLILVMGLVEALGVGSVLPFLTVLSEPGLVEENPWLGAAYEAGGFEDRESFLVALGLAMFAVVIVSLGMKVLTLYASTRFTLMLGHRIALRMLTGYLGQPYAWFLGRHSAELVKTVVGEVNFVVNSVMLPAIQLVAAAVVVVFLTGLVISVDPVVALSAAGLFGLVYGGIFLAMRRSLARLGTQRYEANEARFRIAQEALTGIKDVKVLGREGVLARRFEVPSHRLARTQTLSTLLGEMPRPVLEALLFGGLLMLALQMMLSREGGLMEAIPVIGLYAFAGARLFPQMQMIHHMLSKLRFGQASLEALHADLAGIRAHARALPDAPPAPLGLAHALELRDVHFTYPEAGRAALAGLTMRVGARSRVGIVGGTGAGKTTAVDVILGLLVPDAGALVVDGVALGPEALPAWRRSIGYVPQQIFLADETVAGNIAFGIPPGEIDMAAVERAARIAELHGFVTGELDRGYETRVGERGVRLSGGQRQRIGIARALYHDPDVLVLDEATSALDTLTERAVMEALANIGQAKTVIMIAHRLSTVRDCDEIVLMERGRIVASGPYERLLAESAAFRAMAGGAGGER